MLPLPFRSAFAWFWILSFLFFLSALHRFRLPVAFPTPQPFLSSGPDLPRSSQLVSRLSLSVLLIQLSCLFPFALPCFAPTAVPQVLQLPSGLTLPSAGLSLRPFPPVPPSFVSSAVFPLRSRPFRTLLLGLCFFRSLLQASASQWLPLCSPHFFSPLGSFPWFVFCCLPRSWLASFRSRPSSALLSFGTWFRCSSFHRSRLRLTVAASFRLPTFSGLGLPLSFLLPFVSSGSAFRPLCFRSASSALGSGYWAYRYTLKTEHRLFTLQYHSKTSLSLLCFGQAFGLLVSVSYTHYCASTSDLSTT